MDGNKPIMENAIPKTLEGSSKGRVYVSSGRAYLEGVKGSFKLLLISESSQ
jgi:hypothetical protein